MIGRVYNAQSGKGRFIFFPDLPRRACILDLDDTCERFSADTDLTPDGWHSWPVGEPEEYGYDCLYEEEVPLPYVNGATLCEVSGDGSATLLPLPFRSARR